ncbi:unnamed protein product [Effrenium voratum]|nr:unnamed protein product [Effrenium voratum]
MQSGFEPLAAEVKPLLLHESVELLMQVGGPAAVYVDGSFGQGGHSAEILRHLAPEGRLVALDVNQKAEAARSLSDARLRFVQRSCRDLCQLFGEEEPAGVLLDLSVQLSAQEERAKGLSFQADALDGRLTPWARRADEWLKQVTAAELAWVLQEYGEQSSLLAWRLAEAILHRQAEKGSALTSADLAEVCRAVKIVDDRGLHPAKQVFQAIRVHLNEEIRELRAALCSALKSLRCKGRLVVITLRRQEASEVKRFLREHEAPDLRFAAFVTPRRLVELWPLASTDLPYACRQLCEPIRASAHEVARNPRAKVALLHVPGPWHVGNQAWSIGHDCSAMSLGKGPA